MKFIYKLPLILFGLIFLGLGIIGIFIPLLPTTPFVLLSAWAFAKSSPKLHHWLIHHPLMGPPIKDWSEYGIIGQKIKIIVSILILSSLIYLVLQDSISLWARVLASITMLSVLTFILTRPSKKK